MQKLAVRASEHGHATVRPPERNGPLLLVVEQTEDDTTIVHAVGLRRDVAGKHPEVDRAGGLSAPPKDRVERALAVVAVREADDVTAVVDRFGLDLH